MIRALHSYFSVLLLAFYPFGIHPLKISGIPVHETLLTMTSALFIIALFSQRLHKIKEIHYQAFFGLGLIFVLDGVRLAMTGAKVQSYSGLLYYLSFSGIILFMTDRRAMLYMKTLIASSVLSFILLLIHNSGNSSRFSYYFGNGFDRHNMVDPNILSYGFVISFVAAVILYKNKKLSGSFLFLFWCMCMFIIINTQSRSAFGALILCSIFWFSNDRAIKPLLFATPVLVVSLLILLLNNLNFSSLAEVLEIAARLQSNTHGDVRFAILVDAYLFLTSSASNLILGAGWRTSNPHNIILFVLGSIGILGFLSMTVILYMIFAKAKSLHISLRMMILSGTIAPLFFYHSDKVMFGSLLLLACALHVNQEIRSTS